MREWSRIGLGTVQFGIPYGVANSSGQVSYAAVLEILSRARKAGVRLIDTARGYGTSEQSLGTALQELGLAASFVLCTKLDIGPDYEAKSEGAVLAEVASALQASREALRLEQIPIYQLHVPAHRSWRGGVIWEYLEQRQREGAIGSLGVSMSGGDVQEALELLEDPSVEVLQIPYNALDQRWRRSGVLEKARKRGVRLVGRSAYLQGLLVMPEERVPPHLAGFALPWKRRFRSLAEASGMSPGELALRYALSAPEIATTIVGVDSPEQFESNLGLVAKGPLDPDIVARVERELGGAPERLVVPSRWA